ncbi:SHOCT domain-containing protein [Myceligenerans pegani]|uniref:SHOCT domain-containing protein n=1 Tax=Myceligenerans pegani TaxID=2776917 RepID=A0ABR9MXJ0_9MICO|nr:SHOCT domain-containing protein [Myceligenerans sp. TRM 65318]MBE1875845.1 SHOCT domain-containing protein [Myceligenerans sp. TRM 65318]MBE3018116.1 SHOCT domain-containing protein [Myceligenerans sp. TRM 65318]
MSPLRRFGRPGLIGTAARTAVIAGTAQATTGAIQRRQLRRAERQAEQRAEQRYAGAQYQGAQYEAERQQALAPEAVAPPPEPVSASASNDALLAQLTQLGELHSQDVLDDAEFAAAKAKLLG